MSVVLTTEEYLNKIPKKHRDKFDYSKLNYIDSSKKIEIICPKHGSFWQRPSDHRRGFGCSLCSNKKRHTTKSFIQLAQKIHGTRYDYSEVIYVSMNKQIRLICPKHGNFDMIPNWHVHGSQIGCSLCRMSKGEVSIGRFLDELSIEYERQKKFLGCLSPESGKNYLYDFFLPKQNLCIEFDGAQHFSSKHYRGRTESITKQEELFRLIQLSDKTKTEFCEKEKINLLRISYKQIKNINQILTSILTKDGHLHHIASK